MILIPGLQNGCGSELLTENALKPPQITFFCELALDELKELFSDENLVSSLQTNDAGISLAIRDLTGDRASIVQMLNRKGIPVTAWLLLPEEQGYWFNLENGFAAVKRYQEFCAWTRKHNLAWTAIGLDIEPDLAFMRKVSSDRSQVLPQVFQKMLDRSAYMQGFVIYTQLVSQIRSDGYRVESYQLPLIADERKAKSTFVQRVFHLVDLPVDREVLMLYSSFLPSYGPGLLWSYSPQAEAIALGSTGGGVVLGDGKPLEALDWESFKRDLLLAARFNKPVYVFSLEGCVRQGMLDSIFALDWTEPVILPLRIGQRVDRYRRFLWAALWAASHPLTLAVGLGAILWLRRRLRQKNVRRSGALSTAPG